jgi:hypothetical protein
VHKSLSVLVQLAPIFFFWHHIFFLDYAVFSPSDQLVGVRTQHVLQFCSNGDQMPLDNHHNFEELSNMSHHPISSSSLTNFSEVSFQRRSPILPDLR